ncbi:MAG TPA: hypothetical protein PLK12_13745 [Prolixibacteraceae bacterium]|nr:hypothetical protein [Prolixibacteraceae bacterium]
MKTQILLSLLFLSFVTFSFAQDETETNNQKTLSNLRRVPFQFTLFTPPIGTNGIYFLNTINDVSLNTFIGVGAASNYLEIGGFINANRLYSKGLQLSGFINTNGFDFHASEYESSGFQGSGFANFNGNRFSGFQGAGFININHAFSGFQGAAFANYNTTAERSVQGSGFANITLKGENYAQLAGFMNIGDDVKGIQGAGFMNLADDVKGVQGAGFMNIADEVEGVQAAGFMNISHKAKGVLAAGFINICDSLDGIPLGFINIIKNNGYYSFEVASTDWAPVQLNYRMGMEKFYNIYSVSKLSGPWERLAFGFGLGHTRDLFNKTKLNIELVHHQEFLLQPSRFLFYNERYNSVTQLKAGIKQNLFKNIYLNVGPTLNFGNSYEFASSTYSYTGSIIEPYWKVPSNNYTAFPNWSYRFWVGFHAGISIN